MDGPQVSFANPTLAFYTFSNGIIFQFLLPEPSEMPDPSARVGWKASQPGVQVPDNLKHSH